MKLNPRVIALLSFVAAVAITVVIVQRYGDTVPSMREPLDADWYVRKVAQWELQARVLRIGQVILAALAIVGSVLSASKWKPALLPDGFLAVVAAVSIALLTGLDLTGQANKLRGAERHLTVAILKYRQSPHPSLRRLVKAYEEAEVIVGTYSPQVGAQ